MENNFSFSNIPNRTNQTSVNNLNLSFVNQTVSGYGMPGTSQPFSSQNVFDNYSSQNMSEDYLVPINTKNEDESWINSWLSKIGKLDVNTNETTQDYLSDSNLNIKSKVKHDIPISNARVSLRNCLLVIEKLQSMQEELKSNAETMSSAEWKKKTLEIGMLKDQFSKLISQFENPEAMRYLKTKVARRKRKRFNQKQRKIALREASMKEEEERQKLHKEIDQWLESKREEVERIKSDENMKKDADCILAEVTKKKSDARKQLNLISALVKLRSVREFVALQQGRKVSTEDHQAFAKTTERLIKMWEDSLNVYTKEEQGLRIMLEQNAAEDNIASKIAKEKKIIQEWEVILFGSKVIPSPAYWGLTCADKDMEMFIAIRKSWDTFLAKPDDKEGSHIPVGWVLPDQNALDSWKQYLQQPGK